MTGDAMLAAEFADALLAGGRIIYLQPARPGVVRTVGKLWAWGALAIPCRELDVDGVRCGACPPCDARLEALRVWCP